MTTNNNANVLAVRGESSFSLRPTNLDEALRFAKIIANSDLAPKDYRGKVENCFLAVQMGAEVGLPPMQALQNIALVNGRPALFGDGALAVCQSAPDFEDIVETYDAATGVATCTVTRRGRTPVSRQFSRDDAKKAGLLGKQGPWSQYESRMLQMRARGFALRDAFADRLKGISIAEEVQDYPAEPAPVTISEPKRIGASSTAASAQTSAVPPAETDPADDAAATPAVPAASSQASSPAAASAPSPVTVAPADQTAAGVAIHNTSFSRDKDGQAVYEVQTSAGVFYTRNQELFSALAVIEGTDHTATLTYRMARKGGKTALVLTGVQVDEVPVDEEGAQA